MTPMLDTLEAAARCGGDRALQLQQNLKGLTQIRKENYRNDVKTQADDESQQLAIARFKETYPGIPILGEEDENPQIPGPEYAVFDPLDATWVFMNGCPEWGVNAAYVKDYQLQAVVQYLPAINVLIRAERGSGCYINGERVTLQHDEPLERSILHMVNNSVIGEKVLRDIQVPLMLKAKTLRDLSSCIGGTAEVLQGRSAAFINKHGFVWDYVGALAITEAGGVAVSYDGSPLRWDRLEMGVLFAANQGIADQIIASTQLAKEPGYE